MPSHSTRRIDSRSRVLRDADRPLVESPTTEFAWNSIIDTDMVIAVMGRTGAGKSTLINQIVGSNKMDVSDALHSCTQEIHAVRCHDPDGRRIVLVDSPGFDDTELSDFDILERIAEWLKHIYQAGKMLSGLLYLHRISDNRMANSPMRLLETFKNICGVQAFQNVVLVTTMWSEVTAEEGNQREEELRSNFWASMLKNGSRMMRFHDTQESGWEIISRFRHEPRSLLIQIEMVEQQKSVLETSAGRPFFEWLVELIKTIQKTVKSLRRRLRRAKVRDRSDLQQRIDHETLSLDSYNTRLVKYNSLPSNGTITVSPPQPKSAQRSHSLTTYGHRLVDVTKSTTALKTISQLIDAYPIVGLHRLVEMILKIGEIIEEVQKPNDVVLLTQFQNICDMMCNIMDAAKFGGDVKVTVDSFMTDMFEIERIVNRGSSKDLLMELLSDQSKKAVNDCNRKLVTEFKGFGVNRPTTTAIEDRLDLLIQQLKTAGLS